MFVKVGTSALFIEHEIRLMSGDVKANSCYATRAPPPLADLGNSIGNLVNQLKNGDSSGLTGTQTAITGIEGKAAATGNTITEDPNVANS